MNITKQSYCDFAVWSPHLLLLRIRIFPDQELWEEKSLQADFLNTMDHADIDMPFQTLETGSDSYYFGILNVRD